MTLGVIAGLKLFSRWLTQEGSWAVLDQGLFSVSNLVLNVLLARWLSPQDYGAFATAFAIFLLVGTLHTGLLTDPMLVFGPGRYKNRLSEYLGTLLHGHLGFGVLSGLLLLLASLGLALSGLSALSTALLALALAGPFILLLWLMRRASYARLEPRSAALGSALYMALMLAGVYVCYRLGWLSSASVLGLMGLSSLVVSLWLVVRLRVERPTFGDDGLARDTLENHWRFGRWSVGALMLDWVPGGVFFLLLPLWGGLEASASFRALLNFVLPVHMAVTALSTAFLPSLTQARGEARFDVLVRSAMVFFVFGSVLYWLFLGLFHDSLVTWLYGGRYGEDAYLLWVLGLATIGAAITSVLGAALRAFERPDREFWARILAATFALTVGSLMIFAWGVTGAVLGDVLCWVFASGVMTYLFVTLRASVGKDMEHR